MVEDEAREETAAAAFYWWTQAVRDMMQSILTSLSGFGKIHRRVARAMVGSLVTSLRVDQLFPSPFGSWSQVVLLSAITVSSYLDPGRTEKKKMQNKSHDQEGS